MFTHPSLEPSLIFLIIIRLMAPNTVHLVLTPKHAICAGYHFVSTSRLRDSICGAYFSLFQPWSTNTNHPEHRSSLVTILAFFYKAIVLDPNYLTRLETNEGSLHVPNVSTFTGINDVLMLINWADLGTILVPERYHNGNLEDDVKQTFRNAAHYSYQLIAWLQRNFSLMVTSELEGGIPGHDDSPPYGPGLLEISHYRKFLLCQQIAALKKLAVDRSLISEELQTHSISSQDFRSGIEKDFGEGDERFELYKAYWDRRDCDNLNPWCEDQHMLKYTVQKQSNPSCVVDEQKFIDFTRK
jgi:hypothetical protein